MSSTVIPTMRYADAHAAIDFLTAAFGFSADLVVAEGEVVYHAQLRHGSGMVMLGSGSEEDGGFGDHVSSQTAGVKPVGSVYVVVDDVDGHAEAARAAGAKIVMEPEEQEYGGSVYTCLDPQGGVWSFGSYDPWAEAAE